ncbi:hypothetical protein [Asanoa hainanensis]|uniref:hypothetical protein n=1 Tax=Asanoa hainanensis TaxID=560556 RepID=UPI0015C58ED0|nr:hypothetical protein [Asanoa hainanensis]
MRGVEFVVVFFGAVGGYALLGSPGSPIPVLLVAGGLAFWHLRRRPGVVLWGAAALRPARHLRQRLVGACVEHSLYGVLAFTISLGDLFYHALTVARTCTSGSSRGRKARPSCSARGCPSGTTCCPPTPPTSPRGTPPSWPRR